MRSETDVALQAVSYPYPTDRKRRKLRVAIVTGALARPLTPRKLPAED